MGRGEWDAASSLRLCDVIVNWEQAAVVQRGTCCLAELAQWRIKARNAATKAVKNHVADLAGSKRSVAALTHGTRMTAKRYACSTSCRALLCRQQVLATMLLTVARPSSSCATSANKLKLKFSGCHSSCEMQRHRLPSCKMQRASTRLSWSKLCSCRLLHCSKLCICPIRT